MKKSFVSSLLSLIVLTSYACGPDYRAHRPDEYITFRLFGDEMYGVCYSKWCGDMDYKRQQNIALWQQQCSSTTPTEDIDEVVYQWNQQQIQDLRDAVHAKRRQAYTNAFARWMVARQDTELVDFLQIAKSVEMLRKQYNTKWYYPVSGDDFDTALQSLDEKIRHYQGTRFHDRYALQHLRVLFAAHRFEECVNFWLDNKRLFKDDIIGMMAKEYIAGAAYHCRLSQNDVRLGDIADFWPIFVDRDNTTTLRQRLRAGYDDPNILRKIQDNINDAEYGRSKWSPYDTTFYKNYYHLAEEVLNTYPVSDLARWHYLAAFTADKIGKHDEALTHIHRAAKQAKDADLRASIRVLRMILKAKYATSYDEDLENWFCNELHWLDKQMRRQFNPRYRKEIMRHGMANHLEGRSQYYWSDMMRQVLIGYLAPLCMKSHYTTRALQYVGYADSRIFELVDTVGKELYDFSEETSLYSWKEYQRGGGYLYQNDFFTTIDSVSPRIVERLINRTLHPACPLDRLINPSPSSRSAYLTYLHDIAGTKYLLSQQYVRAMQHLIQVKDEKFTERWNDYLQTDPFAGNSVRPTSPKLSYACEMHRLQQVARRAKNPNDRAEACLRMARGMMRAVSHDNFALTTYYYCSCDYQEYYPPFVRSNIRKTLHQAEEYKERGFTLFTDDERAAKAFADWCMFKTAATRYPHTAAAKNIRSHCDHLADYTIKPLFPCDYKY